MKVLVMGAGAIGGIAGAMMKKSGEDVTLADSFAEHVDRINGDGLRIVGEAGEHLVNVPAVVPGDIEGEYDLAFLAVKAIDTDEALEALGGHLCGDGAVVSLQNGIIEDYIAESIGEKRTIGASTHFSATFEEPGLLNKTSHGGFVVGELDGSITERVKEAGRLLSSVRPSEVTDNIWGHLWSKLLVNVCTNSFGLLTGEKFGEFIKDDGNKRFLSALYTESFDVASKQGIELVKLVGILDPEFLVVRNEEDRKRVKPVLDALGESDQFGNMKSSMLQDHERGRKTEIDFLNGYIVRKGREIDYPTPVNRLIVDMIKEIEEGRRNITPDNVSEGIDELGIE